MIVNVCLYICVGHGVVTVVCSPWYRPSSVFIAFLVVEIETSVGKRSLIINLSMIVTTSNIPERIANFVSIFNRHIH